MAKGQSIEGTATLPLHQLKKLREAADSNNKSKPFGAIIFERFHMSGHISGDNVETKAKLKIAIHGTHWQSRRLLALDDNLAISQLPNVKHVALHIKDGFLWLSSDRPGVYEFELDMVLLGNARKKNIVVLNLDHPTLAKLNLKFSQNHFTVKAPKSQEWSEGKIILGSKKGLTFSWETRKGSKPQIKTTQVADLRRISPHINQMHATFISTQSGRNILQVQHQIVLSEPEQLRISLPDGYRMDTLYIDGQDSKFVQEQGVVTLQIKPHKIGGFTTVVEYTSRANGAPYLLSGHFSIDVPQLNIPVKNLQLAVHLPEVFEYEVKGGSMGRCEDCTTVVEYVDALPSPGVAYRFKEQLISESSPTVEMTYTVELKDNYFKG
jgi:hypothetical protein